MITAGSSTEIGAMTVRHCCSVVAHQLLIYKGIVSSEMVRRQILSVCEPRILGKGADHDGGELALQEISRKKPILANRTAPEIAARIVECSLEQPAFGQIRVANEMRKLGHSISPPEPVEDKAARKASVLRITSRPCSRFASHGDPSAAFS
jgi:hypothetical protein